MERERLAKANRNYALEYIAMASLLWLRLLVPSVLKPCAARGSAHRPATLSGHGASGGRS